MAIGVPFPEANLILRAPTPEDAAAGTVYDLHVNRYRDLDGNPNVISKWKFSLEELAQVTQSGGEFWFNCWGNTHPPIWITGQNPFVRAGQSSGQASADPVPAGYIKLSDVVEWLEGEAAAKRRAINLYAENDLRRADLEGKVVAYGAAATHFASIVPVEGEGS